MKLKNMEVPPKRETNMPETQNNLAPRVRVITEPYSLDDQYEDSRRWLAGLKDRDALRVPPIEKELPASEMPADSERLKDLIDIYKTEIADYRFRLDLMSGIIAGMYSE